MIKALLFLVLIGSISCSGIGRRLASIPPESSFKLYSTTKYLPRSMVIFKRNYPYQGQLRVSVDRSLAAGELLTCKTSSFGRDNTFDEQTYPVIDEAIIPLKPELNTVTCQISNPTKDLELMVKYVPILEEEFTKIDAMLAVLKLTDLKFREMEPAENLCSVDQVAPKQSFIVTSKLINGAVGEFCGKPAEIVPSIFAVACDANGSETWNGFVNIFNDKMLLLKKIKVISPNHDQDGFEWANSVDHERRPIVMNKLAIFATNDGRLLSFNSQGIRISELKLPFIYLSNPQQIPGSLDRFVILGADAISDPENKALLMIKNNQLIKTVDLSAYNEVSSFHLLSESIYIVTSLGEIIHLDYDGNLKAKLKIENNRLSPLLIQDDRLLVGSESGRLYQMDLELTQSKIIYRAFYNGGTDYDVGTNSVYAIRPNFTFAPVILKNGSIVIASENDGRVHFLDAQGKLQKIVSVPFVRDLLGFGISTTASGEEFIAASSISYLEILSTNGDIVAESISTGAEIYDSPARLSSGQFMMGMYNGVFRFQLAPVLGKTVTTKIVRPCP